MDPAATCALARWMSQFENNTWGWWSKCPTPVGKGRNLHLAVFKEPRWSCWSSGHIWIYIVMYNVRTFQFFCSYVAGLWFIRCTPPLYVHKDGTIHSSRPPTLLLTVYSLSCFLKFSEINYISGKKWHRSEWARFLLSKLPTVYLYRCSF